MADLSEERKRQIRAEEEARAIQREEERYREQVRRELEASQAPPHEPEPGSASFSLPAFPQVRGSDPEFAYAPTVRAPPPPVPDSAAGFELLASPLGSAPSQRDRKRLWIAGIALVLASLAVLVLGARAQGDTPVPPTTDVAGAVSLDALVDYLPQDTIAAVGLDLDQARRGPAIGRVVDALLGLTGQSATIAAATRAGELDVVAAGQVLVVAAIPAGGGDPSPLAIIGGPLDEARVETELLAGGGTAETRDASGVTITMRDASVLIRQNLLVIAPAAVLDRAIAAHAGESAADGGPLHDALVAGRAGSAGFTAVRMTDQLRTVLRAFMPDLATAAWFAASLEVSGAVTLTGIGAFPDAATATRIATAAEQRKAAGAKELRAKDPVVARAVDKVVATTSGSTTRLTATIDPAEVDALIAHLR